MRTSTLLSLTVGIFLLTGGCVQTAMLPADTLEDGETRASFSLGEPGALLYPRLSAQVTTGVGGGDLTANLSTVPLPDAPIFGGGLAVRSYLTSGISVEAQLQATSFSDRAAGLLLLGLQTIPSGEGGWYYGTQAGVVRGPSPDVLFGGGYLTRGTRTWTAPTVGATGGYGPIHVGSSTQLQIELKANMPIWGDEGEPPPATSGLSIGIFGLFE